MSIMVMEYGHRMIKVTINTSPQSFIIMFFTRWLNNFGDFNKEILIGWSIRLSTQKFQPLIVIFKRDNFVYHHWGCKLIHRSLSYLFRSIRQDGKTKYAVEFMCICYLLLGRMDKRSCRVARFFNSSNVLQLIIQLAAALLASRGSV